MTLSPYQPPNGLPPEEEGNSGQYLQMIQRRAWAIASVAFIFIAYSAWSILRQQTQYMGSFQLLVEPVNSENANLANPTENKNTNGQGLDYGTQISLMRSPTLLTPTIKEVQAKYPEFGNNTYAVIVNSLDIKQQGGTKLILVEYQSNNADLTQFVLEKLADNYLKYSLNERQTYLRQGLKFVDTQLRSLQKQVDQLQDTLQLFRQKNGFSQPDEYTAELTKQLAALNDQESGIKQQLTVIRARIDTMRSKEGQLVIIAQDTAYQNILEKIQTINTEIAAESTRFREDSPVIQALKQKRNNLLPLLQQQANIAFTEKFADANIQADILNTQLKDIQNAKSKVIPQIQKMPVLTREYSNLQQQLEIASKSLTSFLETRQSLQIQAAQREIPWQVVQKPATFPITNNAVKTLITKIIMGIALGIGVAFLLEKLDQTYHTVADLKKHIRPPIVGILPFNQELVLDQDPNSRGYKRQKKLFNRLKNWILKTSMKLSKSTSKIAVALFDEYNNLAEFFESLRVLQTNMQMIMQDRQARSFVVSSTMSGDGKSTIATSWAEAAVAMGKKVLLIDADFRNAQIHRFFKISNEVGFTTLLESNLEPEKVIQKVLEEKELYVLTAGPFDTVMPDFTDLLTSPRLSYLLTLFSQQFDLIIIDAPTISGLADATLLSCCTDGLVLIVRLSQTDGIILKQTLSDLEIRNIAVTGIIVNGQKGVNPALREAVNR